MEFENVAIYLQRDDIRNAHFGNALWLDFEQTPQAKIKPQRDSCLVSGVFTAKNNGHMGLFAGVVSKIQRYEKWPGSTPKQRP